MAPPKRDWERRIGGRIKLRDLHILSKVVEWGSMAKAASHLAMSQPAVSEAIFNLEAALRLATVRKPTKSKYAPRGSFLQSTGCYSEPLWSFWARF